MKSIDEVRAMLAQARETDPHDHNMLTQLLEATIEYRENRRLFIATMRQPEMRLLRAALYDLRWEHGVDWQAITSMEISPPDPPYFDGWMLETENYLSYCIWPQDEKPDFTVIRLHNANDPLCDCEFCREARICHVHLKHQYIAQPQPTHNTPASFGWQS